MARSSDAPDDLADPPRSDGPASIYFALQSDNLQAQARRRCRVLIDQRLDLASVLAVQPLALAAQTLLNDLIQLGLQLGIAFQQLPQRRCHHAAGSGSQSALAL